MTITNADIQVELEAMKEEAEAKIEISRLRSKLKKLQGDLDAYRECWDDVCREYGESGAGEHLLAFVRSEISETENELNAAIERIV